MSRKIQWLSTQKALTSGVLLLTFLVVTSSAWALVRGGNGPTDATWERMHRDDTLVVGIDPSFPPFGSFGEDHVEGLDADLAQALAEKMGIAHVRFVVLGYDGLYDTLALGFVDVLISALHPEPRRQGNVLYTKPYFDAGQVFVSRADAPLPKDFDELTGQTLAVEIGTEGDSQARRWLGKLDKPPFELQRLIGSEEAMQAIIEGQADVALVDAISAHLFIKDHSELVVSAMPLISDPYVMAVRRSDWRLYLELTQALNALRQTGLLGEIIARWL
ncbi:MAG: amino acid ABC transporter substrate-binding protein [Chloroflexi bacterium]|nr:amino acid ABC transporter substrate-binding protein [Chloroflexota bacterium]